MQPEWSPTPEAIAALEAAIREEFEGPNGWYLDSSNGKGWGGMTWERRGSKPATPAASASNFLAGNAPQSALALPDETFDAALAQANGYVNSGNHDAWDNPIFVRPKNPQTPPPPPPAPVAAPAPVQQPAPQAAPMAAEVANPTAPVQPTTDVAPTSTATPTTTASPTMATNQASTIDPTIQPYLSYGLSEAQKLYQGGGPQYYGGQTYVSPSQQTQTGLQALEQRASQGSPLTGAAQSQLQGTIQGNYLSGNPFFQGAFNPAAQAAESKFKSTLGDIGSAASKAGRYGSGAMSTMQQGASGQFAKTLADTAGTLAYQNYADERGRQQAATMAAPAMAQADYADIQNMLKAGQMREGYTGQQQQADIAKFNFQQNQPQQNLANFLSGVYGNPMGRAGAVSNFQQPSTFQNVLGTAALLGGIEGQTGWLSSGWNKLFGEG